MVQCRTSGKRMLAMFSTLKTALSRLFGGRGESEAREPSGPPVEYRGYRIRATPYRTAGGVACVLATVPPGVATGLGIAAPRNPPASGSEKAAAAGIATGAAAATGSAMVSAGSAASSERFGAGTGTGAAVTLGFFGEK